MGYVFRSGLSACDTGGSLVFLDLPGNRYFALGEVERDACLHLVSGCSPTPGDGPVIGRLVASGVLRHTESDARPQLCSLAPEVRACARDEAASASMNSVALALVRSAVVSAELRLRRFEDILAGMARAKRRLAAGNCAPGDVYRLAAAFARADRVVTALDRCLPRSIALTRAMLASGLAPAFILGVKARPFEAHCWVQLGDILVSDDAGTIAPYTPILIV